MSVDGESWHVLKVPGGQLAPAETAWKISTAESSPASPSLLPLMVSPTAQPWWGSSFERSR